jgi:hypothetical protein
LGTSSITITGGKTITFNGTGTTTVNGNINNAANSTSPITVSAGTVTLGGTNTYTGGTALSGTGILKTGSSTALGNTSNLLTMSGTSTLDLNGSTPGIGGLVGVAANTVLNNSTGSSATLTLGNGTITLGTLFSNTFAGVITFSSRMPTRSEPPPAPWSIPAAFSR